MKKVFDKLSNNSGKFNNAPVKTLDRCIVKSSTDYANGKFPRSAQILDYVRCSIVFDSVSDMYQCINKFVAFINDSNNSNNNDTDCCVTDIVRLKNGFNNILNWQNIMDCEYCDVKANVVIYDASSNISMIGEIQFLVNWIEMAKKIGYVCIFN